MTPVAVLRLIPNFDPTHLPLDSESLSPFLKGDKCLCEVSFYVDENPTLDYRILARLALKLSRWHSKLLGLDALYVQVPLTQLADYLRVGFKVKGAEFQPRGWTVTYVPMILSLK
jgi:hypothetical protein